MATRLPPIPSRFQYPGIGEVPPELPPPVRCDVCDQLIEGEPAGEGVYLWTRGEEIRREPAPLCLGCATAIGLAARFPHEIEEEDG